MDGRGTKIAPDQKLSNGVYPEHFVYLKSLGICGQADLVTIVNGKINIIDYKTNVKISFKTHKKAIALIHNFLYNTKSYNKN